ncbi:MAG: carbon storage regulator [Bdellovibrionales bacterium]
MLVLTRKAGETITIDGDITIQIVQIRGRQVRIGVEAPKHKKVQRGELMNPLNSKEPFILNNSQKTL